MGNRDERLAAARGGRRRDGGGARLHQATSTATRAPAPIWVKRVAAGSIALGTSVEGWRIIRTTGSRLTEIEMRSYPPLVDARPAVRGAVVWAAERHASQRREVDRAPFILHPLEVATLLHGRGLDDDVVRAGVLHDLVEDTDVTIEDLRERFGDRVAGIVAAVTEDPTIEDYTARKTALREQMAVATADAHAVYAADKIAKARELRAQAAHTPQALEDPALQQRLEHYEHSLLTLRQVAPEAALVDQLAFELWAMRALPPHAGR